MSDSSNVQTLDALVVGAGFSGLYMLHKLRDDLNLNVKVLEAGGGVGGTWYWNRYPGARCDSESYYYSYSFSKDLEQEWDWSSRYPEQAEILTYLNHVADRFDLRSNIRFDTRVEHADFDEDTDRWTVQTSTGETFSAPFLISAVGCLSTKNTPPFPGLENFKGEYYHTGAWPHERVSFAGKRVGLIGTGSTGIQATPVIAAEADHLTVFQRTPNFSVPARNAPLSKEELADIKANYDEIRSVTKQSPFGFPVAGSERLAVETPAEERDAIYEELWEDGGLKFLVRGFADILNDEKANKTAADFIRKKIRQIVKDPEVAELLMPNDHPYGTKRPPIDTDYYETFNRDNVALVDVRSAPIEEITSIGLRTTDAEHELDVIVFATGFDAMTGSLVNMDIHGVGGVNLKDEWEGGPRTYLGLQIAGFPNLFTITGPQSPSVLTNMPVAIEQHVEWIADCIEHLRGAGIARMEATPEAQENWSKEVAEIGEGTLFPKANSWYVGANVPGKPRVFMPYVGGMDVYRARCNDVVDAGYEGFALKTS